MNISLRKGEKIYMNGAVFRVDRKVSIELLNNVSFLLENHVMKREEATTPMRQLYFIVQTMLIAPGDAESALKLCAGMLATLRDASGDLRLSEGLAGVARHVGERRPFEALKILRSLFPVEAELLDARSTVSEQAHA
ncbi:MAG: flagellar biosynthesis repressor FlbT [Methylocystis sp.]